MPLATTFLACALLWGTAPPPHQAPEAAGFIADVSGRWDIIRSGTAGLIPAQRRGVVNEGDTLQKRDDDPSAYIVVALYTGTMPKYTSTKKLPVRASAGALTRVMHAIQQRFQEGWVTASVRGGGEYHDAVVKTEGARTDVSAIFRGTDPGAYTVTVYAIDGGRPTTPPRVSARVSANGGAVTIPALAPGLYQVDVSSGPMGTGGSAWIRVVPVERYDAAAKEFAQLPGADGAGGPEVRRAARAIARTYLIVLDDAAPAKR